MSKVYIHYGYDDDDNEAPINEVWSEGTKPKKKMLKEPGVVKVYDCADDGKTLINGRYWDGEE